MKNLVHFTLSLVVITGIMIAILMGIASMVETTAPKAAVCACGSDGGAL